MKHKLGNNILSMTHFFFIFYKSNKLREHVDIHCMFDQLENWHCI